VRHSHNPAVMLKVYAKWLAGSTDKDVTKITAAMGFAIRGFERRVACIAQR